MQAISDLTWLKHMLFGRVEEELALGSCRAVALRIPEDPQRAQGQYHFRLLVFPPGFGKPVLSLNLESSILGEYLLTGQIGGEHRTYGAGRERMSYAEFRAWALERAGEELGPLVR